MSTPGAPVEATPIHVYAAWARWWRRPRGRPPTAEEMACRQLALQAALLRARQLEVRLEDLRCPACWAVVPNVLAEGHAATCDAVASVRRWRLAANEVECLRELLPDAQRAAVPDPFESPPGWWSAVDEDTYCQALAGRGAFRVRLSAALWFLLDHECEAACISSDDLGLVERDEHVPSALDRHVALFLAVICSEDGLDSLRWRDCPWCDRRMAHDARLAHLVDCPKHPCLEPSAVLEDWAEAAREGPRHAVVAVLEQLHARRTGLRQLLAACDDLEDAERRWGPAGGQRAAGEQQFAAALESIAAPAVTPLRLVDAPAGSNLEFAVRRAQSMHSQLAGLLVASRDYAGCFSEQRGCVRRPRQTLEQAWRKARLSARAAVSYRAEWNLNPSAQPPALAVLKTFEGRPIWRTGAPLLEGPALEERLRGSLGGPFVVYCT